MRDWTTPHAHAVALIAMIQQRERDAAAALVSELDSSDDLPGVAVALAELATSLCELAAELVYAVDHPEPGDRGSAGDAELRALAQQIVASYGLAAARLRLSIR